VQIRDGKAEGGLSMRTKLATAFTCGALAIGLIARPAQSAVQYYDIYYNLFYSQTTAAPPLGYFSANFTARIIAQPGDILTAAFSPLGADPIALSELSPAYFAFQDNFVTDAQLLNRYTPGPYTFFVTGGFLGNQNGQISRLGAPFWCEAIPAFTPESFGAMQNVDASRDFSAGFNTFVAPAPANVGLTVFAVFDGSNAVAYIAPLPPDFGSVTIPAGTLARGHNYVAVLYFSSRIQTATPEFNGTTEIIGFDRITSAPLITRRACVGDLNSDGLVDDSDFVLFVVGYNLLDCADPAMPAGCLADLNVDGSVDDADFVIFVPAYNDLVCP